MWTFRICREGPDEQTLPEEWVWLGAAISDSGSSRLRELPVLLALAILARSLSRQDHTPLGEVEEFTRAAAAE